MLWLQLPPATENICANSPGYHTPRAEVILGPRTLHARWDCIIPWVWLDGMKWLVLVRGFKACSRVVGDVYMSDYLIPVRNRAVMYCPAQR